MSEVDALRADTPGTAEAAYFMSAGAALAPLPVDRAIRRHLDLELRIGGYEAATARHDELEAVYGSVARLIGAAPDEIALTENATVAWQLAFYSLPFQPGDRILTGEAEYGANYVAYLQVQRRHGVSVEVVPSDPHGQIDTTALEQMIDERVRLISLTWVPTNGGLVNPAVEVGRIARRHGIFYLLDACQAVGQLPVDVSELGCDAMSATGRKFLRGPRGTGFLFVRREALISLEPPMVDHYSAPWTALDRYTLRDDARRFETWENSYALRAGLGAAVDYALAIGIDRIRERTSALAERLRHGIEDIPRARMLDLGIERCAIVSFALDGVPADDLVAAARAERIVVGTSGPHSTLVDASRRHLGVINRASPHYFNTEDEVDQLVGFLRGQAR
ncbi:aminotransferase class V-fold PLP-dependent enzyme [Microbacterium sp. RD1]|uniref:aminotransferase class V-fold PLP-dependent enzyme n=1 Tax=Microbacterium sp. RD1 TaxID=3457313 RepID=UPI003FA52928